MEVSVENTSVVQVVAIFLGDVEVSSSISEPFVWIEIPGSLLTLVWNYNNREDDWLFKDRKQDWLASELSIHNLSHSTLEMDDREVDWTFENREHTWHFA